MDVGQMDYDKLRHLLDNIMPLAKSINLTGLGETFLYKKLPEISEAILNYPKEIKTFLSTNAQTPNCLHMFEQIRDKVNLVQISIDGVGETYQKVRNKASFSTLTANVKKMAEMAAGTKTSLMFNVVAFPINYQTLPDIVRFAKDVGVGHVHINSRNLTTIPEVDINEYEFYRTAEFKSFVHAAEEIAQKLGVGFSIYDNNGFCELVYNHFYITWDGFLVPCCAKPFPKELHFGNVFDESLTACIRSYQTSLFRSDWDNNNTPSFCRRCHVLH
jgi:radical SAM protein with 4Fe4S-binding SPASM domain